MSEEGPSHTSVLLPEARVTLFTRDDGTRAALEALKEDWRFARVTVEVREGDVETAIFYYAEYESPSLVIIQTEDINDGFSDRLEELAGNCDEGTGAIVVGPVNDVNLYRKLIGMGVSDYLVKPLDAEALGNNIAEALIDKLGAGNSRLVALMGAKGGVGVSSLAQALAWGLADDYKQKTFLLDAAGGWSTLSVGLGYEPSTTLNEASRAAVEGNDDSLTRMIHKADEKLSVLSSGGDVMLDDIAEAQPYEALLDHLLGFYPIVIVDLSASPANLRRTVLSRAHEIMLVTSPLLPSVRAARTLLQEIAQLRGGEAAEVDLIVNMRGVSSKYEVSKSQIETGLDQEIAVSIPYDSDLFTGVESEGKKLLEEKSGKPIVTELLELVRSVLAIGPDGPVNKENAGKKKGGVKTFLSKLTGK